MRSCRSNQLCGKRAALACLVIVLFAAMLRPADARTRRRHKARSFPVVLQPFLMARSAIHGIADPIIYRAPRVVAAVATAPVRIAYRATTRPVSTEDDYNEEADERDFGAAEDPRIYRGRTVRTAQPPDLSQPIRVAYVTSSKRSVPQPRAELGDDDDGADEFFQPEDDRVEPKFESSGSKPIVNGSRAVLRNGIAYAPSRAPQRVKNAIWAANTLRRKPYVWGGGHGSFFDRGYDCSGTVSFALHGAGALSSPLPSSDFMRYGERGRGRWITIYSRRGHTFAMIAGLRLDTTDFRNGGNTGPRWHADARDTGGYVTRHPAGM